MYHMKGFLQAECRDAAFTNEGHIIQHDCFLPFVIDYDPALNRPNPYSTP